MEMMRLRLPFGRYSTFGRSHHVAETEMPMTLAIIAKRRIMLRIRKALMPTTAETNHEASASISPSTSVMGEINNRQRTRNGDCFWELAGCPLAEVGVPSERRGVRLTFRSSR